MPVPHSAMSAAVLRVLGFRLSGLRLDFGVRAGPSTCGTAANSQQLPGNSGLRTLIYGNYGIFLTMGSAGFLSSTVVRGALLHLQVCCPV